MQHAITFVIAALCILAIAYRLYGVFFVRKVLQADDKLVTPSHQLEDGKNYVPTNKWLNFGQHFAAIAAAGPLVGPVLAAQYGYLPSFLWLLIGCVIGGAVHDTVVLVRLHETSGQVSLRGGQSRTRPHRGLVYRPCDALHHHHHHGGSLHGGGARAGA